MEALMLESPRAFALFVALTALASFLGCTPLPQREGSCRVNSALSCNTVLAGNPDAGVELGLTGYSCEGPARPDDNGQFIHGVPYGQICAAQSTPGDYCCTPEDDLANCVYNPVAICPEGYGYKCMGPNRPDVNNPALTCGNGVRDHDYIHYCCQPEPRPPGCVQSRGASQCALGLLGWSCPEGWRPRGEDYGSNESRSDYYYFVCSVPTPLPNPEYSIYCCFIPSPTLPGSSCVYNPGITKSIPSCGSGRFGFACYGYDTPQQNYLPIRCNDPPVKGLSDDGYPANLYCCDYVPPAGGSGTGTGLDEED